MGRGREVCRMLKEVEGYLSLHVSDQRSFVRYYLRHGRRRGIEIDVDGAMFVTLHGVEDKAVIEGRGEVKIGEFGGGEGGGIAVVHGNAGGLGGKKFYEDLAKGLLEGEGRRVVVPPAYAVAVAKYGRGDREGALETFLKFVGSEEGGGNAEAMYNLGVVTGGLGRKKESEKWYKRCLEVEKERTGCLINLGVMLLELGEGRKEEGLKLLERAGEIDLVRGEALKAFVEEKRREGRGEL